MTPEQLSDLARQIGVVAVLLALAVALHREWLVLGREYRACKDRAEAAERRAEEWQAIALGQVGISTRAVGVMERIAQQPPQGDS